MVKVSSVKNKQMNYTPIALNAARYILAALLGFGVAFVYVFAHKP